MQVGVEHVRGWAIAKTISTSTAKEVIEVLKGDIMAPFCSPRFVISDNATSFNANDVSQRTPRHHQEDGDSVRTNVDWQSRTNYSHSKGIYDLETSTMSRALGQTVTEGAVWIQVPSFEERPFSI